MSMKRDGRRSSSWRSKRRVSRKKNEEVDEEIFSQSEEQTRRSTTITRMQRNCRKKSSRANYYTGKKLLSWEDEGSLVSSSSSLCQKVLQERDFLLPLLWPFLPAWRRWRGVRDRSHLLLWIPSQSIYRTKFIHKKSSDSGPLPETVKKKREKKAEQAQERKEAGREEERREEAGRETERRSRRKRAHNLCETLLLINFFSLC